MELVDGRRQDRFFMPRRPVQRVEGDPAVDPAGGVARVQGVRQRWQQVFGDAGRFLHDLQRLAADRLRELERREAADQGFCEDAVVEAFEVTAQLVDEAEADLVGHDLVVENPLLAFRDRDGLGQQVVHLHHVDAAVAHLGDEVEVVALGVLDPEHVVEQQLVAVGRRETLVRTSGRADHHLAQLADFRMDTELDFVCACHDWVDSLNAVDAGYQRERAPLESP